jgi:uncharacterized phage protein (TIGR02218 family)
MTLTSFFSQKNLYRFDNNGVIYTWTNVNKKISYNSETYYPETITRGNIAQSREQARSSLSITVPRTNPLGKFFISQAQEWPVSIIVYEIKGSQTTTVFTGSVQTFGAAINEVTFECETIKASQRIAGLRGRYQKTCRHALYERGCNLNANDFATAMVCTSILSKDKIRVPLAANLTNGDLTGGMVRYKGVRKYVRHHNGEVLTLMNSFISLNNEVYDSGSADITVYAGCAHNFTVCLNKFDNLDNFGGFPWLPIDNPFTRTSIAY